MTAPAIMDLRHLVRAAQRDAEPLLTPREVADQILATLPDHALRAALAQALPGYVRDILGGDRRTPPRPPTPQNLSPKVARAITSNWHRIRQGILHVGPGEYRRIGDCTFDDLMFAARERREDAAKRIAWAERYEKVAGLLAEHGVARLDDLPDEVTAMVATILT